MNKKVKRKKSVFNYPQIFQKLLFLIFIIFSSLFYTQKIHFVTADLGRHIKNGEIFFENFFPISTNFYSYTEPLYPAINHHWGSGIIFYLVWKLVKFEGLSIFYILINVLSIYIFFKISKKVSNFSFAIFFSVLSLPLITFRKEIRPEGFSYLLIAIYYLLLSREREKVLNWKTFIIIQFLQILWVNLHIFYIFGPFLIFTFLVESLVNKDSRLLKYYSVLFLSTVAVSFINPFGLKGFLIPFTIFKEYGYMIVENQSVIFMQRRFGDKVYYHFQILFLLHILSFFVIGMRKNLKNYIGILLISLFFALLSWKAIRFFPIFGLFFAPISSKNFYTSVQIYLPKFLQKINNFIIFLSIVVISKGILFPAGHYSPFKGNFGIGLVDKVQSSAIFFLNNKIEGPIFNNYDIGGYLIFNLFPTYKVFIDNRPEAYSSSFFKDIYIPMQEDENKWKEIEKRYNFNVIYFYRHDLTPWAQPFLIRRINDPSWAPVYVDDYVLILLKRDIKNKNIIEKYELPKSIFHVIKT